MGLSALGGQLLEGLKLLSLSEVVGVVIGVTIVYVSNVIVSSTCLLPFSL